jgi:hypothetical protein
VLARSPWDLSHSEEEIVTRDVDAYVRDIPGIALRVQYSYRQSNSRISSSDPGERYVLGRGDVSPGSPGWYHSTRYSDEQIPRDIDWVRWPSREGLRTGRSR